MRMCACISMYDRGHDRDRDDRDHFREVDKFDQPAASIISIYCSVLSSSKHNVLSPSTQCIY